VDLLREAFDLIIGSQVGDRRQRLSVGGDDCIYDPAGRLLAACGVRKVGFVCKSGG